MSGPLERTSFLASANSTFVAELYARYLEKPATVDPEWAAFFDELKDDTPDILKDLIGASWSPRETAVIGTETAAEVMKTNGATSPGTNGADLGGVTRDSIQALMIIRSHRVRGHLYADLDPLGLEKPLSHTELDPESYGFSEADYDREIYIHDRLGLVASPGVDDADLLLARLVGDVDQLLAVGVERAPALAGAASAGDR